MTATADDQADAVLRRLRGARRVRVPVLKWHLAIIEELVAQQVMTEGSANGLQNFFLQIIDRADLGSRRRRHDRRSSIWRHDNGCGGITWEWA